MCKEFENYRRKAIKLINDFVDFGYGLNEEEREVHFYKSLLGEEIMRLAHVQDLKDDEVHLLFRDEKFKEFAEKNYDK
jgi:hypothetical protein